MSSTTTLSQVISTSARSSEAQWRGKLRYIPPGQTPTPSPHNFHLPAMAEFGDVRLQGLIDMRPVPTIAELRNAKEGTAQLATHGFTAIRHPTTMNSPPYSPASWKEPTLLKQLYVPETEEMVKQVTGAKTVITEALLLRSAIWSEADALATHAGHGDQEGGEVKPAEKSQAEKDLELGFPQFIGFSPQHGGASPAPKVHLDYAPNGARTHLRKYHPTMTAVAKPIIEAEEKLLAEGKSLRDEYASSGLGPRWALYSIWRPLKRVRRDPLALGDARTFLESDYVPVIVKTPNLGVSEESKETHDTESYLARWSSGQKWYFISEQEPEEVLVIGLFDSERDKETVAAGGTLHSSVDLEGTENEEARESIELRCLAIW
ncbi:GA4 desaturase [Cladophialophora carrionii]|uniref:GA4 desaturase n=1 Tax=Cladophialophora carrionii TaxID=86049 RepID=A0A1C1CWR7_9EURO|nr:GA4 desaturase [Cladophialophora carrionii]